MGLLDSLKGLGKEELGRVPVPGEASIDLPEGKVSLRWEEARGDRYDKNARVPTPHDLVVEVIPAAGAASLEVRKATGGTSGAGGGKIYRPFGHVIVTEPGPHRIRVETGEARVDPVLIVRA